MTKRARAHLSARYRWSVFSRATAAIVGGYVLTALVVAALAAFMPGSRSNSVLAATLASFPIYVAIALAVSALRTAARSVRLALAKSAH